MFCYLLLFPKNHSVLSLGLFTPFIFVFSIFHSFTTALFRCCTNMNLGFRRFVMFPRFLSVCLQSRPPGVVNPFPHTGRLRIPMPGPRFPGWFLLLLLLLPLLAAGASHPAVALRTTAAAPTPTVARHRVAPPAWSDSALEFSVGFRWCTSKSYQWH